MHMASLIATGFSVVTTLDRTRVIAAHLAESYGMARFCKAIRATEVAVLELEDKASQARRTILEECRRAVIEDRSGAVVLGCAGMADLAADIAAVKLVESLVSLGLRTSKTGDLAYPIPKSYRGDFADLAPTTRTE
jgi:allantoin racemase